MAGELLKVRKQIKKRKPTFRRQQSNQFAKFKNDDAWRRPKGLQSKMRLKRKGHRKMPTIGFKSPKAVRGLNAAGLEEVIVLNVEGLNSIDKNTQIAVIGRTVGARKKIAILEAAKSAKLAIANVKDIDATIKKLTKAPKKAEKKVEKKTDKKADKKTESKKEVKAESKKEEAKEE